MANFACFCPCCPSSFRLQHQYLWRTSKANMVFGGFFAERLVMAFGSVSKIQSDYLSIHLSIVPINQSINRSIGLSLQISANDRNFDVMWKITSPLPTSQPLENWCALNLQNNSLLKLKTNQLDIPIKYIQALVVSKIWVNFRRRKDISNYHIE